MQLDFDSTAATGLQCSGTPPKPVSPPQPPSPPGSGSAAAKAFINELHYDNSGADKGEFVEIAGPAGTDVSGWQVVGYNGRDGQTYQLAGTFPQGTKLANAVSGLGFAALDTPGIQNSKDGLALVNAAGNVLDFISYGGTFTAAAGPAKGKESFDIGVAESRDTAEGASLGRVDNGTGKPDWEAFAKNSRGRANAGQGA
jgi:uncharacterized protein